MYIESFSKEDDSLFEEKIDNPNLVPEKLVAVKQYLNNNEFEKFKSS